MGRKMKAVFLFPLFLFFWTCFSSARDICSITINSSDEVEIFKKHLSRTGDFRFIELVPLHKKNALPNDTHWFSAACRRTDLRCEVLIVSGHFGGLFFGEEHTYILPVDIMQKASCSRSCPGLLSHLKYVYLFGCNTLAGKDPDHRSPEEYLQVLLDHNMARDMAEQVASARYLPFGLSFQEQMQMVFLSGIAGFTSLSPLGKDIRGPLNNYLHGINKHYGSYLDWLNRYNTDNLGRSILLQTIGGTVKEVRGTGPKDERFRNICQLYKDDVGKAEGMQVVRKLMESGEGRKAYLSIKSFISKNRPFTGQSLSLFNSIRQNARFKNNFLPLYTRISPRLPYVKVQFLNFLNFFHWVDKSFYKQELRANVLKMILNPTSEAYDYATALVHDEKIPALSLSAKDLPSGFYKNLWSALIMETLNVQDFRAQRRLMNRACIATMEKDPVHCYQVFKSLGHLNVTDSALIYKMAEFLKTPHAGLVYYAIYGLGYSGAQIGSIHQDIAYHCNNPESWFEKLSNTDKKWLRLQTVRSLALLKSQDQKSAGELVNCINSKQEGTYTVRDEEIIYETLKALYYMNPRANSLRASIKKRQLDKHPNPKIKKISQTLLNRL